MNNILADLKNGKVKKMIFDTDAYNEVDDQFALAYSILTPDIELIGINAAPFLNFRSSSFEDGMLKSYDEILKIAELAGHPGETPVFKGSRSPLPDRKTPVESEAAENIVNTVMSSDERIYVIATGAITNVASALLMKPEIAERMTVLWLGCNSFEWNSPYEFNMEQDIPAARALFDSGVDLIHLPAFGVTSSMKTSLPELRECIGGRNALCDYLYDIVAKEVGEDSFAASRIVWDVAAPVIIAHPECADYCVLPTPRIADNGYYSYDLNRKPYVYVRTVERDCIFYHNFKTIGSIK